MIDIPLRRITAKEAVKLGLIDAIKNDETTLTGVYLIDKNLKMDFAQRNFFFTTKENEIVSKPGDIWLLGKHRIICGNSLEQETFTKTCNIMIV